MRKLPPNYIGAARPVNQRTAAQHDLKPEVMHPLVEQRLAKAKARKRFGAPLAERLRGQAAVQHVRLSRLAIAGCLVSAAALAGGVLATLSASLLLGAASGAALLGGAALLVRGWRSSHAAEGASDALEALFDAPSLAAFDQVVAAAATEVEPAAAEQLLRIQTLLADIGLRAPAANGEYFTAEDGMYVKQCLRRYVPDSLQSYLRVAKSERGSVVSNDGHSANNLLASQLDLLAAELEKKKRKLAQEEAEAMLKQQRFLLSKKSP